MQQCSYSIGLSTSLPDASATAPSRLHRPSLFALFGPLLHFSPRSSLLSMSPLVLVTCSQHGLGPLPWSEQVDGRVPASQMRRLGLWAQWSWLSDTVRSNFALERASLPCEFMGRLRPRLSLEHQGNRTWNWGLGVGQACLCSGEEGAQSPSQRSSHKLNLPSEMERSQANKR